MTISNPNRRNWVYVRMHYPSLSALDRALGQLADDPDFPTFLRGDGWFYLRYMDKLGPQLRLRSLCRETKPSEFVEWAADWYHRTPHSAEDGDQLVVGRQGVCVATYRPELAKYGTPEIVNTVEDHWIVECDRTLGLWRAGTKKVHRIATFAASAASVFAETSERENIPGAMRLHAWYWQRSVVPVVAPQARFVDSLRAQMAGRRGTNQALSAHLAAETVRVIASITQMDGSHQPAQYRFNLLHILANRLGLSPVEEALTLLAMAGVAEQCVSHDIHQLEPVV